MGVILLEKKKALIDRVVGEDSTSTGRDEGREEKSSKKEILVMGGSKEVRACTAKHASKRLNHSRSQKQKTSTTKRTQNQNKQQKQKTKQNRKELEKKGVGGKGGLQHHATGGKGMGDFPQAQKKKCENAVISILGKGEEKRIWGRKKGDGWLGSLGSRGEDGLSPTDREEWGEPLGVGGD